MTRAGGGEGALPTVAHIITRLDLGGAQQNTLDTCAALDRSRYRVRLLFGPGGPLDAELSRLRPAEAAPVPSLGRSIGAADARALAELTAALRSMERPLIVHTHSSKAGVLGRAAARAVGAEFVVHSIHGFGFHEGQAAWVRSAYVQAERKAAAWTDAFVSVSRANVAEAQARGIIGQQHIVRVIRSGMDLAAFVPGPAEEARMRLGVPLGTPFIVCIGNLKPQKDPLTMVDAFARLVRDRPQAMLWFVGDGPLRPAVERRIRARALEHRFNLVGWRKDVPDLIRASDIVASSAVFEGLPRAAVQAVRAQRPFVGTRVDGTSEIVRNGRGGLLVEPRDPEALAHALARGLDERPVEEDPARWCEAWSKERLVSEQDALYRALLSRSGSAPRPSFGPP